MSLSHLVPEKLFIMYVTSHTTDQIHKVSSGRSNADSSFVSSRFISCLLYMPDATTYYISFLIHMIILASSYYPNNGSSSVILDYKPVSSALK